MRAGTWFDQEHVLFRSTGGRPVLAEAYCPHLGAHLGRGGTVVDGELRCPFHGLRFAADGACSHNPRGRVPAAARIAVGHVVERLGTVFGWYDPLGREPWFELPELDEEGWSPFLGHCWEGLSTHPQEVTENSVDIAHFADVHHYTDFEATAPLTVAGPRLSTSYRFTRPAMIRGLPTMPTLIDITVVGLGFSLVEVSVPSMALRMRHLVLPTPVEQGIDLRTALSVQHRGARLPPVLHRAVHGMQRRLLRLVSTFVFRDISDDHEIWSHKRYLARPVLAEGDGPIGRYRVWCRQFYPEAVPQPERARSQGQGAQLAS